MDFNRVLLTGGAGFIGSFILKKLIDDGKEVVMVDDLSRGNIENIDAKDSEYDFLKLDLTDNVSIDRLKSKLTIFQPELVIHYGAVNGTLHFYDHPLRTSYVNSYGTYNLLEAISSSCVDSVKKIVFASTSEVYGEPSEIPTTESALTYARIDEDRDSYSVAKQMSEFYVKLWAQKNRVPYNILRIFNVYGPKMVSSKYGQVVPELIARSLSGEYPLEVIGGGKQTRSFCFIDDHVNKVFAIINESQLENEIINVGNDQEISIAILAKRIQYLLGLAPNIVAIEDRKGDINRRCPSIEKFKKYNPEFDFTTLDVGLSKTIDYYKAIL